MSQFEYYNDPNSTVDVRKPSRDAMDNTITYTGWEAVNLSKEVLPEIGLFVPFVWPRIDHPDGSFTLVSMSWNNGKDGWFTPDFNGEGYSLLVSLRIVTPDDTPDGRLAAGKVADQTQTGAFDPVFGPGFPEETLHAGDKLPFEDLGSLARHEEVPFDLVFTYEWGHDSPREGALRTGFGAYTLAPTDYVL